MNKKLYTSVLSLLASVLFAQDLKKENVDVAVLKMAYLDSIKTTFTNHNTSNCIDERWLAELSNEEIFEDMYADVTEIDIDSTVTFDLSTDVLKKRLKKLDDKSPFNIEYNPALENVIKTFLKKRQGAYERLMAISEYYFPMFEEHLAKYDVPLEIKYLAIVESALNPKAKSRVGATGLWQFMYPTGKQFDLEVNSFVDERYDPLKATEAACQYLSSLYRIFGDWSMVLASYNAGPGNVSKAIRRSGGSQNYWNIRKNLPRETANYVPAFLATMYIYEYHKEHKFKPQKAPLTYFETDTIMVKRRISFEQISEILDVPIEQIAFLNPIYKLDIIPYQEDKAHYLRLPKNKLGLFVSNEEKVYAYVDYLDSFKEKTILPNTSEEALVSTTKYHKIRSGESLGSIANKYNVTITQLKNWNNLRGNSIQAGKNLKIFSTERVSTNSYSNSSNASSNQVYRVKKGDSLYSIAKKFPGISAEDIKKWNGISGNNIRPGMKLNING
ncbi:MAG: lytic transglycosylase [Flavobacterium sp.]|nr:MULTISPECIES: lytic transglycosylase domain-containing protein [unclassified Flavobacterium]MBF02699.1 lytic transglycosylase [Flavobacterium sp.]MCO6161713.1 LysM peptidoglycan-binding domain-containing protein [Flavobacterium sp. NRK F7]|tara:strand:+ start:163 stop:1662 length:1500 start_codon:yes stop_codon:yes gene_type:complete